VLTIILVTEIIGSKKASSVKAENFVVKVVKEEMVLNVGWIFIEIGSESPKQFLKIYKLRTR